MLPLASLAARRFRAPHHIFATCRIASRSRSAASASPALHFPYGHSRLFSATPARTDDNAPEPSKDAAADSKPTPPQQVKKEKKKRTPEENQVATAEAQANSSSKTKPEKKKKKKKKNDAQTPRDAKVLQGALTALKNVLDAQNISVPGSAKAKPPKKPKQSVEQPDGAADDQKTAQESTGSPKKKKKAAAKAAASQSKISNTPTGAKGQKKWNAPPVAGKKPPSIRKFIAKSTNPIPTKPKPDAESGGKPTAPIKGMKKPLGKVNIEIEHIYSDDLNLVPIEKAQPAVPPVSYGLDRVLFNPGVYQLQDPRSRVFNFDPYLSKIMPIQEFDFNALKQYITSSKDDTLINIARENNKRYTGSTSSMTSMLAHFHYLLSSWRELNPEMLSKGFNVPSKNFTKILTCPAAVFLHWKDGVYAIDADKEFDTANILSMLGKSMEKLLTLSREDYERYRTINSDQISEEERNADEAYHYTGLGDFMMRSQLDAHDPRVPGTGMFDLKTRAVISIRMDAEGFHKGLGYEIRDRFGDWQSFEREYYDMIRSAFLKYSLQVRMGRMDGIFVAFHNTERIFGFQYIPLPEMDLSLHGTSDTTLGDKEFKLSLALLNNLMDRASKRFPEQSLRLHFETRPSGVAPFMYIFATPVGTEDIKKVQEANKAAVEAFERKVLGLGVADADTSPLPDSEVAAEDVPLEEDELEAALTEPTEAVPTKDVPDADVWEAVRAYVEDAMEDDELGVAAVKEAIEDALEQSGLLNDQSTEETRSYVEALLNALSPDTLPEQIEGTIADPDDAADAEDHIEDEPSTSDDVDEMETSEESPASSSAAGENAAEVNTMAEEKPDETTDTAEHENQDISTQESRDDINAELVIESREAISEPSISSSTEEPTSETSIPASELDRDGLKPDEQAQEEDLKETPDTSGLSNLKNLIVRMAQSIDEREVSENDLDEEDDSKLKEFERILGKMMATSRGTPITGQAGDAEVDGDKESSDASTEPFAEAAKASSETETKVWGENELLGMVLTVRNKVNGSYVTRPEQLDAKDKWDIEYNIQEMPAARASTLYEALMKRRRNTLESDGTRDAAWYEMFSGSLETHTNAGRKFREEEDAAARKRPVHVVGREARSYEETFGEDKASEQDAEAAETPKEEI